MKSSLDQLSALVHSVIGINDKKWFRATQKSIVLTFGRVCGKNSLFNPGKKLGCPSKKGIRGNCLNITNQL